MGGEGWRGAGREGKGNWSVCKMKETQGSLKMEERQK